MVPSLKVHAMVILFNVAMDMKHHPHQIQASIPVCVVCWKHSFEKLQNLVFWFLLCHHLSLCHYNSTLPWLVPAIEFPTPCLCGLTEAAVEEQLQGGDVSIRKPVNTLPLSLIKCRSTPLHYATDQNGCLLADRVFLFLPLKSDLKIPISYLIIDCSELSIKGRRLVTWNSKITV